jgi:hypothetical protein
MQFAEERNILRIGPPAQPGETEITPAMVDELHQRIRDAGGILNVWTVLFEDVYESKFGDGFYLYLRGIALNSADAHGLAALAGGDTEHEKWHVRSYRLALKDDAPVFTALWRPEERFTNQRYHRTLARNPAVRDRLEAAHRIGLSQGRPVPVDSRKMIAISLSEEARIESLVSGSFFDRLNNGLALRGSPLAVA